MTTDPQYEPPMPSNSAGPQDQIPPVQSAPPGQYVPPQWLMAQPQKPSAARKALKILCWCIFIFSLLLNFVWLMSSASSVERSMMKKTVLLPGKEDQVIALYEVKGVIDDAQDAKLAKFCDEIVDDQNIKAVLLRVDSPGGGLTASDQMCRRIKQLKEKGKKIIVSMGSVAASGGYYISAPADEIFAEPTTLTGSIGVIATWVVIKDGLEKIGIQPVVMKSTSAQIWKDEISIFSRQTDLQRQHYQMILDSCQARFDEVVKEGRGVKLKIKTVSYEVKADSSPESKTVTVNQTEPLNAKIYMGAEAIEPGLIDKVGYQDDAINSAKTIAELTRPRVVKYEQQTSLLDMMLQGKANQSLQLNTKLLDEFQSVRIMAIWQGQ